MENPISNRAAPSRSENQRAVSNPPPGRSCRQKASQAYFSIDSALAITIALFSFASFALILSSAAANASSGASQASSSLLALRFSSFVLEKSALSGGAGPGAYRSENEIDVSRLGAIDLNDALLRTGRKFARISLKSRNGELFSAEQGERGGREVFCARRLAVSSGQICLLEACLS